MILNVWLSSYVQWLIILTFSKLCYFYFYFYSQLGSYQKHVAASTSLQGNLYGPPLLARLYGTEASLQKEDDFNGKGYVLLLWITWKLILIAIRIGLDTSIVHLVDNLNLYNHMFCSVVLIIMGYTCIMSIICTTYLTLLVIFISDSKGMICLHLLRQGGKLMICIH